MKQKPKMKQTKNNMKQKLVYFDEKLWKKLRIHCISNGIKIADAIDDILRDFLKTKNHSLKQ